jgi:hypothetical protein
MDLAAVLVFGMALTPFRIAPSQSASDSPAIMLDSTCGGNVSRTAHV